MLDSGRVIKAEDIKSADSEPQLLLILDLPTIEIFYKLKQ